MPVPFLESIARAYASRQNDLSGHLFIFPNRRACTFFIRNLSLELGDKAVLLPSVTTMSDFVEDVSGRVVASRIEILFMMYRAYCNMLQEDGVSELPEFDTFRRWGETALSDFNEVDMHDVDADAVFKNVKDLREISANFLTEQQLEVMEEFFGYSYDPQTMATEFWKKFDENEDDHLHSKFRMLWQVLAPLYHKLSEELSAKGVVTSGGAYRIAADILEKEVPTSLHASKIVMVGFNALTRTEQRIFDALASYSVDDGSEPFVDFFWDMPGPVISSLSSTAGRYVQHGISRWAAPDWALPYLTESDISEMPPDLRVISVPSNSLQTKVVADILSDMAGRLPEEDFKDAKIAVVLPDERLLIPMLYSLPDVVDDVNLTMGYPLRLSGVATFVSLLRRMQAGRRKTSRGVGYYYKDFNLVLSHPFSHVLFGHDVSKVKEWIKHNHRSIVDVSELRQETPSIASLLAPLPDDASPQDVAAWLNNLLTAISECIAEDGMVDLREDSGNSMKPEMQVIKNNVDLANIEAYRHALALVLDTASQYMVGMHWTTFLSMTERLVSAETVTFEGQPLKGLQVMGLLETRSLDFERIVIPSLNERVLPARRRAHTFISDSLRKAYGLPPVNYSESLFSYYFYRMIARAKEVVMLYDSRSSDGARSGDVSRYILQLKYLYARDSLVMETRTFEMSQSELKPHPVAKTDETMLLLSSFTDPGAEGSNLSATALTKYTSCQLRFYFEHVLRIRTDEEAVDYIDAMTQGDIVHFVMENIYLPPEKQARYLKHPELIDAKFIKARLTDRTTINRLIRIAINKLHFHMPEEKLETPLTGSAAYVAKILRRQVMAILEFDLSQTPFFLYGVEIAANVSLELPDYAPVNMRFAIDRLDKVHVKDGVKEYDILRIVDYKTGSVHAVAESMESVFAGEYTGRNLLQLWLYANLFDALQDKCMDKDAPRPLLQLFEKRENIPSQPMLLELYDVNAILKGIHTYPVIEAETQMSHSLQNEAFLSNLEAMLCQIFDKDIPFEPTSDPDTCRLCPFKAICWR